MSCGTALEARRNSDERWTFTPSSRNYTFSGMAPLFTVRRGETVLLQIDQTQTVNGSLFSVVGDSVVLQLKKGDAALLDGPTPDTDAEALFYDVTLTDQTGFENWIVGGSFTLLGLNDVSCGGCNEKVEVTIGGQCIQINIEGGNLGIGASVNLAALNQAVQDAETAAGEAEQSAAEAATAGATAGAAAGATAGSASGAAAGAASGEAAAQSVVASKVEKATTLSALTNVGSTEAVVVTPLGRFRWVNGDQSANVSADPLKGIWVAPALVPSGASGAWRRDYNGPIDPEWFGGLTSAACNAALAYARATGQNHIKATGSYFCSETILYRGNGGQSVFFDASDATFTRASDYGVTMMFAGLADGSEALQQCKVLVGGFVDANSSMTVANSPFHLVMDHIFFVTWNVTQISNGAGFVAVRGCASDIFVGRGSWRDYGPYKPGSKGYYKGPSVDNPAVHGGDSGMTGVIDVYGGDMRIRTGQTSGSSATITLNDASWIAPGDIITGNGLDGSDPYALIPVDTTVISVSGATVTVSNSVTLPPGTSLVFYRCSMDDGFQIASSDGFWGEGFVHSICFRKNSFRFGSDQQFSNVRIKLMADFAPGASMRFEGSYGVFHSAFYSHHQYGQTVISTDVSTALIEYDGTRSNKGFDYEGIVRSSDVRYKNSSGVTRYGHSVNVSGQMVTQHYDGSGVLVGNVFEVTPGSRTVTNRFDPTFPGRSVADLSLDPLIYADAGTEVFCFNARSLQLGGTIEGAGAGTGSLVIKKGDNNWYLVGTNIPAQA